ncbi:suppressor of fused domain protein [Actinomadura sp. 9N407]|uniref:suppressor of fused domain protein n=1 Tax=Actinomadura sp. 9N407 TaxID=3375154 RepID=UPI0037A5DE7D
MDETPTEPPVEPFGPEDELDDEAPGWQAINGALERIYGDTKPYHWGTLLKWSLGGRDPLDGISVHARTEPVPHWHYISYGMSELYGKAEDGDPEESGWGFEFTFRLARDPAEETPPVWAANLLQNLGRYVFSSGNHFEAGHHMDANGPIAADRADSEIQAVVFATDPELGAISTPNGRLEFLQVVGLAREEYEAARQWNAGSMLEILEPRIPLFVTDIDRGSLLADPEVAAAVQAGVEREGSSSGMLYVTTAGWADEPDGTTVLRLGALQAPMIRQSLSGRLPYGRELYVVADDMTLCFEPADGFSLARENGVLKIGVPEGALDGLLGAIRSESGRTPVPSLPGLAVEIVPTRMRDQYGNETGEVIG